MIKNRIKQLIEVDWQNLKAIQPEDVKIQNNLDALKASLIKHGFSLPFAVWIDGADIYTIDGHTRKKALQELQAEGVEIPDKLKAVEIEAKDRKEAVQILVEVFNQKHNPFDNEVLINWLDVEQVEIQDLEAVNLSSPIIEKSEAQEDDFEIPDEDEIETDIKLGDLIEIGRHRLLCGDSTDSDQVAKLMNGEKADMVFTDPPYKIQTEGGCKGVTGEALRKQGKDIEFISDFNPSDFLKTMPLVFENKIMNAYVFCNKDLLPDYLVWARDIGYSFNVLIWKKPNAIPIGDSHRPDIEYLLLFRKSAIWNNSLKDVNYSRCLEFGRERGLHPTMKPIGLISNEMKISSNVNSLIVDFFLGSGTTMVAAHQLNRKCYGMELDSKYVEVIVRRMIKLDNALTIKRNGIDETQKWLDKLA